MPFRPGRFGKPSYMETYGGLLSGEVNDPTGKPWALAGPGCPRLARGSLTFAATTGRLPFLFSPPGSGGSAAAWRRWVYDCLADVAANLTMPRASRGHLGAERGGRGVANVGPRNEAPGNPHRPARGPAPVVSFPCPSFPCPSVRIGRLPIITALPKHGVPPSLCLPGCDQPRNTGQRRAEGMLGQGMADRPSAPADERPSNRRLIPRARQSPASSVRIGRPQIITALPKDGVPPPCASQVVFRPCNTTRSPSKKVECPLSGFAHL